MNLLTETYLKLALEEFWKQIEVDYMSEADLDQNLARLLKASDKLIFEKFGIDKSDKVYFICGSARLYLYPKLREALNLKSVIGDLDMVIPDRKLWDKAGIEGSVYRPSDEYNIEAFDTWEPSQAGGEYADVSVRSDKEILRDSSQVFGYYFMSLYDIIDYKLKMNREKEKDVVDLFKRYLESPTRNRVGFLKRMAEIIGLENTKEFISTGKVN